MSRSDSRAVMSAALHARAVAVIARLSARVFALRSLCLWAFIRARALPARVRGPVDQSQGRFVRAAARRASSPAAVSVYGRGAGRGVACIGASLFV